MKELHIATDRESHPPDAAVKVYSSASLPRSANVATSVISRVGEPGADQQDENLTLVENLRKRDIDRPSDKIEDRFFAKSSGANLIQTTMELKSEYVGSNSFEPSPSMSPGHKRSEFYAPQPVCPVLFPR